MLKNYCETSSHEPQILQPLDQWRFIFTQLGPTTVMMDGALMAQNKMWVLPENHKIVQNLIKKTIQSVYIYLLLKI